MFNSTEMCNTVKVSNYDPVVDLDIQFGNRNNTMKVFLTDPRQSTHYRKYWYIW